MVRIRRYALGFSAGLALAACSSQTDSALADAQQVCTDLGYENGTSDRANGSSGSSIDDWSSGEWAEAEAKLNDIANRAARAAREDRRWDRLSNAVTDLVAGAGPLAKVKDETLPQYDRDAAQAELDRINPKKVLRALDQECRKVQAR
ncbi:hypothetical protein ACWELO_00910 [Streptomyces sp. NPDC004596]